MDDISAIIMLYNLFVFFTIYVYLYLQSRKKYMFCWSLTILFFILKYFLISIYIGQGNINDASLFIQIINSLLAVIGTSFVLVGMYCFVDKRIKKSWLYVFAILYITSILIVLLKLNVNLLSYISNTCIAAMLIWSAYVLLKLPLIIRWEKKLTVFILAVWGIQIAAIPYIAGYVGFTYENYSISMMLGIICGIGLLIMHFQKSKADLLENEQRFQFLTEKAQDIVFRFRPLPKFKMEYISPAVWSVTGYPPRAYYREKNLLLKIIHPDDLHDMKNIISANNIHQTAFSFRIITKKKKMVWLEIRCVPVYNKKKKIVAYDGIARDISENKEFENRLQYLSNHDPLTGLHNRSYFEEWLNSVSVDSCRTIGIIICDIDGLKLVNDTLGHSTGDVFLKDAANIIKSSFRENDFVARIGGDEFAIILTDCDKADIERACTRLRQRLRDYNNRKPRLPIHISMGYAYSSICDRYKDIDRLYKDADDKMYNNKIKQSKNAREAMLESLLNALEEKDFAQDGHTENMQELMEKLAKFIGLDYEATKQCKRLAYLHDIGKIVISDDIIYKPAPLTKREEEEVKRHCEIGYRITHSVNELKDLADLILKHHEWWDGNGYPLGLKGEEIPLECRMLSIIDAYDVMTGNRPYRLKLTHEEALIELKKQAGTQFDPWLVQAFVDSFQDGLTKENIIAHGGKT